MNRNFVASIILITSLLFYVIFSFVAAEIPHPLSGFTFLSGAFFAILLFFSSPLKNKLSNSKNPLKTYFILMIIAGFLLELFAYIGNIPKILAGQEVFLFSTNIIIDLLIGTPHYIALALVWMWFIKRYHITVTQQLFTIGIFWAIKVDQFNHLFMLGQGIIGLFSLNIPMFIVGVLDFFVAGSIVAFMLSWPLLLLGDKLKSEFPKRKTAWTKYLVAIPVQIFPFIVLFITGFIYHVIILGS